MKLGFKIILPILLLLFIVTGAFGFILFQLRQQEFMLSIEGQKIRALNGLSERLSRQQEQTEYNVLAYRFNQDRTSLLAITQAEIDKSKTLDEMFPFITTIRGRELINNYIESRKEIESLKNDLIASVDEGNQEKIWLAYNKWSLATQNIQAALADIGAYNINSLEKTLVTVGDIRNKIFDIVSILFFIVITIVVFLFFYLRAVITRPIIKLAQFADDVASENFTTTTTTTTTRKDELGTLSRAFNTMTLKLKKSFDTLESEVSDRTKELQKFKLAVEGASDLIIITDADGTILYANSATEQVTGFPREEIMGKKAGSLELWGGLMDKKFYTNLWKTIKIDKQPFIGEVQNKRKNGKPFVAYASIYPILDERKNVDFFVEIDRDITKEKSIDKAKTEFVSLASHQLKTPLTSISWYTEMLLQDRGGKMTKKANTYLKTIFHNNQRMIELVNSLLNVSRIEMGTLKISPQPVNFLEVADSVLEELSPQMKAKKLTLKKNYEKNLAIIKGDPQLVQIIFQNLLSNSVKYTPNKGIISLTIETQSPNILITVSDTGCGIPKLQQSQIFTKLFRADNALENDTDGTGLGLYIVKSVVEKMGGKIWFESTQDKGTNFYVTVPLKGIKKQEGTKALALGSSLF